MTTPSGIPETEGEIIPLMLKIAPGFQQRWDNYLQHWDNEPPGIYTSIGQFAHYIVDSVDSNAPWLPEFFRLIELMVVEGNEDIQLLVTVGFLEDILTISSWRPHKGEVFLQWLGPESKKFWDKSDKLWSKYGSLTNILRAETQKKRQKLRNINIRRLFRRRHSS
jgi:hypothetical protein